MRDLSELKSGISSGMIFSITSWLINYPEVHVGMYINGHTAYGVFHSHLFLLIPVMASADPRKELECFICLNISTDPVTLKCGHSFCLYCIGRLLDTKRSEGYSCPKCKQEFQEWPAPCNIVDNFLSARLHRKTSEHVYEPTTSPENRKCSVHNELLKYYCTKDFTCICLSCRLDEEHWEHQVESMDKASEIRKKKLRNVLKKLMAERGETEQIVQSLQEHRSKVQGNAHLEIKEEELVRKMGDIKKLCNMTDPLSVLQESDASDLCDDREGHDELLYDGGDLNVAGISQTLHKGLSEIMSGVNFAGTHVFPVFGAKDKVIPGLTDLLLDVSTAGNTLRISDDRKALAFILSHQSLPETPERFWCSQVLSSQSFSSGRLCWEVNVQGSDWWRIGMCYPSIDRRGVQSVIGYNEKSWCLERYGGNRYSVIHGFRAMPIPGNVYSNRIRIDVNFWAGRIAFYDLCDPIRLLVSITTTFTEPLHAGLGVWNGCIRISLAYQM
ncbi:E3 ubiquitin-protein ligase TRIM21-like [Aquarana catesbeiana]|uniref:E3 ubiquitin-protein ligase TRIM21-like n=1 Tax=Aquarana catesbeiana TaxID=8400 RepID=UPI003CCA3466